MQDIFVIPSHHKTEVEKRGGVSGMKEMEWLSCVGKIKGLYTE